MRRRPKRLASWVDGIGLTTEPAMIARIRRLAPPCITCQPTRAIVWALEGVPGNPMVAKCAACPEPLWTRTWGGVKLESFEMLRCTLAADRKCIVAGDAFWTLVKRFPEFWMYWEIPF